MIEPGIAFGNYFKLSEIIVQKRLIAKKVVFEFQEGFVLADGKIVQGLKIVDSNAFIKGVHYTSWENATQIRSINGILSSLDDPFVYLAPRGAMQDWPEEEICRELGAHSANTEILIELVVPIERVWIKASRRIVHFAIEGDLVSEFISDLRIQRRK
ncbi:Uncharacterised protein [uncultured archaeon]|nr:Uncharacterised protein [uncultured archaeon]